MNVSRFVSLGAAIVFSAIQWAAFFNPAPHTQSVQEVGASAADDSLPMVVVTARRESWAML
jgi:hypothetical protein